MRLKQHIPTHPITTPVCRDMATSPMCTQEPTSYPDWVQPLPQDTLAKVLRAFNIRLNDDWLRCPVILIDVRTDGNA